jgi:ABC-type sugar transport system ATPase subunit
MQQSPMNGSTSAGAVYVQTNAVPNEVIAFRRSGDGSLDRIGSVATGSDGTGSPHLTSQGSVALTREARERGIEAVYQDLAVAPQLDAVANIFLGRERRRAGILRWFGFLDQQRMRKGTEEQLEELHVRIPNVTRALSTFSGGQRQGVAVARAVMWASKVVIMDEPTAALGVAQVGMVLNLVKRVRQAGIPVVFISHNMPHVFEVADRIVVLRLGEVVAELDPQEATTDDAVAAMTGSLQETGEAT